MMAIKDNFLSEAHIGSDVEMMVGTKEFTGEILSLDASTVKIKTVDGKSPTIALDLIAYYEITDKASVDSTIAPSETVTFGNKEKQSDPVLTNSVIDFNAIESHGLVFETCFWQEKISDLAVTPKIQEESKELDASNELLNRLNALINKLRYCDKVNELDPKYGRIQPIVREIDSICDTYHNDILYELLAIILIRMGSTYKEALNKSCTNRMIRLGDAVVCYNKKRYEEMAYYCSEYYLNVKLTEQNFDDFLYVIPYLIKNGYQELFANKQQEVKNLSATRQAVFAAVYNNSKSVSAHVPTVYFPQKEENSLTAGGKSALSEVMLDEFKDKIDRQIHSGNINQAYGMVEKKFKEHPENEELSYLLQYVSRVKANAAKYKNLPSDASFYAKALRDWHIYEDTVSARKNFLQSIRQKESRYFSAIMDYVDLIMHTDGEESAVETLMSYKDDIRSLDSDSRIKYYEKLCSLYQKAKDYKKLLQCLNSLKDLYETKIKNTKNVAVRNKFQTKVAGTIFRISQAQYSQGKYKLAIETAKKSMQSGHNLNACVNQIVSCYISLNDYDTAREIVKEYMGKDYNLIGLFEKIDKLEEAYHNGLEGASNNSPVDVYELLGFDNEFISHYEGTCGFEGISEERKISGEFTEEDLNTIENEIKYASKAKPKDRADYYLTAACIEKSINVRGDKYYGFISNSMLYHGHLLLANKKFDSAKSFYLTAISLSQMTNNAKRTEQDAVCSYLYCVLKNAKTQSAGESIEFGSEIMILLPQLSKMLSVPSVTNDIVRLLNTSRLLKEFFEENKNQQICERILDRVMSFLNCKQVGEELWVKTGEKYKEAETFFNKWYSAVQLDKNFEHDIDAEVTDVTKSVLVTPLDVEYITRYQEYCKGIREYAEYSDFDNRIRILNQGMNEFEELTSVGHRNSTLFFENYLLRVIRISVENLSNIISRTGEDYKPELGIDVPITNIPDDNGKVNLSVTIFNAENKATARNIELVVMDNDQRVIFRNGITNNNLKGGAETSELIKIPVKGSSAFTVNIILNYVDDENEAFSVKKQISISTNAEDFEKIRNPYITGKPVVNDEMFFGRKALVQRLVEAINDDRIRCVIIYGQKRTGKSSVFDHLKRQLTDKFIVLNFSVGADITSEMNFYKSVQNEFVVYLDDNDFDEDTINFFKDFIIRDFIDFEKFIGEANRNISKPNNKEILLMIDEFTHIYTYIKDSTYDIGENFMDKWKAMIEKNLFKSALIGQDFMPDFIQEYANQFQVTDPIYVSYLERRYAIELVTKPIALSDGSSRFLEGSEEMIVDWFNGQPYYLQTYCSRLVDYINEYQKQNYITTAVARKVKDMMLGSVQLDFFDNLVRSDETDELEVVLKLAQASDIPGSKININRLQLSEEQIETLGKLANRNVVDYVQSEQKCGIVIPFFHEWLRQSY